MTEPLFNDECECAEITQLRENVQEARRLMTLALDFWSAPGIDNAVEAAAAAFDAMVVFLEDTGVPYKCKWDNEGNYTGEPTKSVGMPAESDFLFVVQKARKRDDTHYGHSHFSCDGDTTVCGLETDDKWWIHKASEGVKVTCKKCKAMRAREV